jgi:hypothetical protein
MQQMVQPFGLNAQKLLSPVELQLVLEKFSLVLPQEI